MVKALHRAGIEVILDVVYNHTAEGNHLGPTLAFKGVDNESYYRLMPDEPRFYQDFTGTGNSLNPVHPSVLRLIMDSLRYFVIECHVDGFRFDLASALAREFYEVDRLSTFFDTIHQDPIISQVKLIAEPWDVGPGGYQVGNFPVLWAEWNGPYRDTMRDFWRGSGTLGAFASRFTGSSDLYQADGRDPFASINFVTAHDGFTLRDLVSYNEKHNEANGEEQSRRHRRQPLVEPRRRRRHGRSRDQRATRTAAAQLHHDATPLAGHPHGPGRRRARPHAARQQQRVVPGQRDLVVRLGARRPGSARVRASRDRAAARASRVPPRDVPHRHRGSRLGTPGCVVVQAGRTAHDAARLAAGPRPHARRLPQRPARSRRAPSTARRSSTTRSCSSSTRTPIRSRSRCRRDASAPAGRCSSPRARGRRTGPSALGRRSTVQDRSLTVLRRP